MKMYALVRELCSIFFLKNLGPDCDSAQILRFASNGNFLDRFRSTGYLLQVIDEQLNIQSILCGRFIFQMNLS